MIRFIAVIWPSNAATANTSTAFVERLIEKRPGNWSTVLSAPGVRVLYTNAGSGSNRVYRLQGDQGVMFGRVFHSAPAAAPHFPKASIDLNEVETRRILDTQGRALIDSYWGRYVAVIRDPQTKVINVVRDPQGGVPCFRVKREESYLFFSHIEDCVAFGLNFSVDYSYVEDYLLSPNRLTDRTGLEGVTELRGGDCFELEPNGIERRKNYWDPLNFAAHDPLEDESQAAVHLREVTRACTTAWASDHSDIVLELSGGLDSAIVLSCLKKSSRQLGITALNYYIASSQVGDERHYAREAAHQATIDLVEIAEESARVPLEDILTVRKAARPNWYYGHLARGRVLKKLVAQRGASAVFNGLGGDQIFYLEPAIFTAADYIRQHGLDRKYFQLVSDIALGQGMSIWGVLASSVCIGLLRQKSHPLDAHELTPQLISSDLASKWCPTSPISSDVLSSSALAGKSWHAENLSFMQDPFDPFDSSETCETVMPLTSQPLVELVLRIPIYVLAANGIDRKLARTAFRDDIPRCISARRTKGAIDENMPRVLASKRQFVRDVMLDGALVRRGFLDRAKLDQLLTEDNPPSGSLVSELLCEHLSTEAWLRSWQ